MTNTALITKAVTMEPTPAPKGAWHREACEMRQNGATYAQIAKKFGVSAPAAYFAVNPHKRFPSRKKATDVGFAA